MSHTVDYLLNSVSSVKEALQWVQQVQDIREKAGFQFRKQLPNGKDLLGQQGETNTAINKLLPVDKYRTHERVLGVTQIPSEDVFTINHQVLGADRMKQRCARSFVL